MKPFSKILVGSLLLSGLQFTLGGCASEGSVSGSVYYGPHYRDPWFHDDPWMYGHRRYRREPRRVDSVDIYISPPRPPAPPRIRLP